MAQMATTATIRKAMAMRSGRLRRRAAASISPVFGMSVTKRFSRHRASRLRLAVADARIDQRIGKIDDEIDDDDEAGEHHRRALDEGNVALLHRFDGERAQAGQGEGDFHEN